MALSILTYRRCDNIQCRVETFKAADLVPLNGCPICLMPGISMQNPYLKEDDSAKG